MTHAPAAAFAHTSGSARPRIVLVGEAFGGNEADLGKPFVGEAGKELFRMLGEAFPLVEPELHARICELHRYGLAWVRDREAWLEAAGIAMTNVLAFRPPDNKLERICGTKKEVEAAAAAGGKGYLYPPISKGKYLRPEYLPELDRLAEEIRTLQPNLIIALGNTACWALLRATNIGSIRGAVTATAPDGPGGGIKCLPTYHPAGVLRQWAWRPIVVADLMKAGRESQFAEIQRPRRSILINPTKSEVIEYFTDTLLQGSVYDPILVACDTETEAGQITCISFAPLKYNAMVIPFWDKTQPGWSYWPESEERVIWDLIQQFMESSCVRLLWQNGLYDFQYVMPMKIRVSRSTEDTMLLHHSLFPELQKGLGFLGSLYTNEASWKLMRRWKSDSEKKDE